MKGFFVVMINELPPQEYEMKLIKLVATRGSLLFFDNFDGLKITVNIDYIS